jgi:TolA-binding protein
MAEEKNTPEVELTGLDKLQDTYEKNANTINIGLVLLLLVVGGLVYYLKVAQPKAEITAQEALFEAQLYFEQDSFQRALNSGLLEVAQKHGRTKAGRLAHYYAGISYFHLGDYNNAAYYLSRFKTDNDVLRAIAASALADAQMETGDAASALKNYKVSATATKNEAVAPVMLFKAALAHEQQGKTQEAINFFKEIKEKYPNSPQGTDIDKYLGRVEAKL